MQRLPLSSDQEEIEPIETTRLLSIPTRDYQSTSVSEQHTRTVATRPVNDFEVYEKLEPNPHHLLTECLALLESHANTHRLGRRSTVSISSLFALALTGCLVVTILKINSDNNSFPGEVTTYTNKIYNSTVAYLDGSCGSLHHNTSDVLGWCATAYPTADICKFVPSNAYSPALETCCEDSAATLCRCMNTALHSNYPGCSDWPHQTSLPYVLALVLAIAVLAFTAGAVLATRSSFAPCDGRSLQELRQRSFRGWQHIFDSPRALKLEDLSQSFINKIQTVAGHFGFNFLRSCTLQDVFNKLKEFQSTGSEHRVKFFSAGMKKNKFYHDQDGTQKIAPLFRFLNGEQGKSLPAPRELVHIILNNLDSQEKSILEKDDIAQLAAKVNGMQR